MRLERDTREHSYGRTDYDRKDEANTDRHWHTFPQLDSDPAQYATDCATQQSEHRARPEQLPEPTADTHGYHRGSQLAQVKPACAGNAHHDAVEDRPGHADQ